MHGQCDDPRHLENGWRIPSQSYADQSYIVVLPDGSWLCTLTTVDGQEGDAGQHILALRSEDKGRSWQTPVALEPPDGPEASWAVPLHVPNIGGVLGRVYVFYVYNRDNVRQAPCSLGTTNRVDTLGAYVFRYSDDGGRTWSAERFEVPVREFDVDRANASKGKIRYFWGVAKPVVHDERVVIALHKVGDFGAGFLCQTEGCFVVSDNLLHESAPEKLCWETLPDGDAGLRAPEGEVSEEQSVVALSDGSLFCVWRTVAGYPAHAYSRDGGHSWTAPAPLCDAAGRIMKQPRAANFVWHRRNGRYLYWFHHHGLKNYAGRNPVWLCSGHEADGPGGKILQWSQPEVLLYDDDPLKGISYPDLIEDAGKTYISATQKTVARVHEIPPALLDALELQWESRAISRDGLAWETNRSGVMEMPPLPLLQSTRGGFTLEMRARFADLAPWQVLFDARDAAGHGLFLQLTDRGTLQFSMNGGVLAGSRGGLAECGWESDLAQWQAGAWHHITVIVDGGPKIISFVIDGLHHNGGNERPFGWGRFHPDLEEVSGAKCAQIAPRWNGTLDFCRFYTRPLLISEAVAHWRAGPLSHT
jgi:hypothetical protein